MCACMRYYIPAISLSLLATPAFAQDIVVTGQGLPPALGDKAYDIVVIDRARLTAEASGRIDNVLEDVAGYQAFRRADSRAANPTSQGVTLRALGGNASSRALVTLDGVPIADPFAGYIPLSALAPERLGELRVTRGAGAGAFGSGALAGSIELATANASTLPLLSAGASYGSRDSFSGDALLAGSLGAGQAMVFGRYDRGDGYVLTPKGQRGPLDVPSRYRQWSAGFRTAAPLSDSVELQTGGLAFDDRRLRGVEGIDSRLRGGMMNVRLVGSGDWAWEALGYAQIMRFDNRNASLNAARSVATPALDQYNTPATGLGGKIELRPPTGEAVQLRVGLDVRDQQGRTQELSSFSAGAFTRIRQAGGRNRTAGGYLEASATPASALTLTAGARLDRWWIGDGTLDERLIATGAPTISQHFASRAEWEPTVRAGAAYAFTPALSVRAAGYRGYRLPTLNELYRPFRVGQDATAANSALRPERLHGVEAGADFRPLPALQLGITAFWNKLDNAIGNVTLGVGPGTFDQIGFVAAGGVYRQRINLDAIRARGIEAEAHLRYADWRADASYAYTDARVHGSGLRPSQTPRSQASVTLGWAPAAGPQLSLTARYTGAQNEDDLGVRSLDGFATLDAYASFPLTDRFAVVLRAENVTDTRIESGVSATGVYDLGTPRTLWAGVRVKLS